MKRIPYVILISLLFLSGCQSQPGNEDPTARVGSITDDVPEINIPETDIDFSQFSTLDARMQAWGLGKDKDENGQPRIPFGQPDAGHPLIERIHDRRRGQSE